MSDPQPAMAQDGNQGMDEADFRTYRVLLAQHDNLHDEADAEVRLAIRGDNPRREGRLPEMCRRPSPENGEFSGWAEQRESETTGSACSRSR